eukprot:scaffold90250_cov24-Prasinocladus_malaysianus.AAC.1
MSTMATQRWKMVMADSFVKYCVKYQVSYLVTVCIDSYHVQPYTQCISPYRLAEKVITLKQ